MSDHLRSISSKEVRRNLWRPASTRDLALGICLALSLPWLAALLVENLSAFERFPGTTFLLATVAAALVGRLLASLVAVATSAVLMAVFELPPVSGVAELRPADLFALALFVALASIVAYALALKDAATEEAAEHRTDAERLALALAGERNTMQQVLQQMPNGVIVVDADGQVRMMNAQARTLLSMSEEEPTGVVPLARSLSGGEIVRGERVELGPEQGAATVVEVDCAPIVTEDGITGAVGVLKDVTERVEGERRLAGTTARLRQIQAVTDATLTGLRFDDMAERLLMTIRDVLTTDSATLLLVDRSGTSLREHMTVGVETDPTQPVPIGQGIAGTIAGTLSPLVIDDISTYPVVRHWLADHMRSIMGVPLVYRGQVRGVIHVASTTSRHFSDDEVQVLSLAANRIASALERAALYEGRSRMADALQRSLTPAGLPTIDGMGLAATYRPYTADDEIGGDFYDVFPHGPDAWGVVVGDVSGKGPDAAAIMGLAAHSLRAIAAYEDRPSSVLAALNRTLLAAEKVAAERFCTACEFRLRTEADHARVTLCLAGHPRPFLVRADGQVCQVGTPGTILGTFDDPTLHDEVIDLFPGDTLVAYTDGLVERRGRAIEEGEALVRAVLAASAGAHAQDVVDRVTAELLDPDVLDDDVAIVVVTKT